MTNKQEQICKISLKCQYQICVVCFFELINLFHGFDIHPFMNTRHTSHSTISFVPNLAHILSRIIRSVSMLLIYWTYIRHRRRIMQPEKKKRVNVENFPNANGRKNYYCYYAIYLPLVVMCKLAILLSIEQYGDGMRCRWCHGKIVWNGNRNSAAMVFRSVLTILKAFGLNLINLKHWTESCMHFIVKHINFW